MLINVMLIKNMYHADLCIEQRLKFLKSINLFVFEISKLTPKLKFRKSSPSPYHYCPKSKQIAINISLCYLNGKECKLPMILMTNITRQLLKINEVSLQYSPIWRPYERISFVYRCSDVSSNTKIS